MSLIILFDVKCTELQTVGLWFTGVCLREAINVAIQWRNDPSSEVSGYRRGLQTEVRLQTV